MHRQDPSIVLRAREVGVSSDARRGCVRASALACAAVVSIACGDDGGGAAPSTESDTADSGFTTGSGGGEGDDGGSDGNLDGTAYSGDIEGVMTFVRTSVPAMSEDPRVGLVGGYRLAELGFDGVEDLYSPVAYQLPFAPLPEDPDSVVFDGALAPFAWGTQDQWLRAGNGMKLRRGEEGPAALACLVAYFDTVADPDGFPLYLSTETSAPECQPAPESFESAAVYDLVLYGGDAFTDNVLPERVTTPPLLELSAPDLAIYGAPHSGDLEVAWTAVEDADTRIAIRLIDGDGHVLSAHAADDGAFTIPAEQLAELTPGMVDLVIAREHIDRVQFTDGGMTITSRDEHWGSLYLD